MLLQRWRMTSPLPQCRTLITDTGVVHAGVANAADYSGPSLLRAPYWERGAEGDGGVVRNCLTWPGACV